MRPRHHVSILAIISRHPVKISLLTASSDYRVIGMIARIPEHLRVTITARPGPFDPFAPYTGLRSQALQFLLREEGVHFTRSVDPFGAPCTTSTPKSTPLDVNSHVQTIRQTNNLNPGSATGGNNLSYLAGNTSGDSEGKYSENHSRSMSCAHSEHAETFGTPRSSAIKDTGSDVGPQICQNHLISAIRMIISRKNADDTMMAGGHRNQKEKPSAQILPCPIENCPGRDTSISELM
jgi:hypothetical protein